MTEWVRKAGACLAIAMLVSGCAKPDPERALRERIASLQADIEARDASAVQQFLADDFIGNDGMDRRQAKALATMLMLRHQSLGVTFGPLQVEMRPPASANVSFSALASGGSGGLIPEQMQTYTVRTAWREVGGDWLMYHAEWEPRL